MPRIKKQWLLLTVSVLLLIWYLQATPNYKRLEVLLATNNWREADRETTEIILRRSNWSVSTLRMWGTALVSGELIGWYEPIKQYPCRDLRLLDRLWLKYSNQRFGLSIQQQIFERITAQSRDEFKAYDTFINEVKWDRSRSGSLSNPPKGYFPSDAWVKATTYGKGEPWMRSAVYMYDRIQECQMSQP